MIVNDCKRIKRCQFLIWLCRLLTRCWCCRCTVKTLPSLRNDEGLYICSLPRRKKHMTSWSSRLQAEESQCKWSRKWYDVIGSGAATTSPRLDYVKASNLNTIAFHFMIAQRIERNPPLDLKLGAYWAGLAYSSVVLDKESSESDI